MMPLPLEWQVEVALERATREQAATVKRMFLISDNIKSIGESAGEYRKKGLLIVADGFQAEALRLTEILRKQLRLYFHARFN